MGIVAARCVIGGGGLVLIDAYPAGDGWQWETDPEGGGADRRRNEDAYSCVGAVGCVDRGCEEEYTWEGDTLALCPVETVVTRLGTPHKHQGYKP
jgi:hypothetical protein